MCVILLVNSEPLFISFKISHATLMNCTLTSLLLLLIVFVPGTCFYPGQCNSWPFVRAFVMLSFCTIPGTQGHLVYARERPSQQKNRSNTGYMVV